jgi:hypothetical protein
MKAQLDVQDAWVLEGITDVLQYEFRTMLVHTSSNCAPNNDFLPVLSLDMHQL